MEGQDRKEAYRQKIEAQLDEWSAKIDQLKARARQLDADARIELDRRIKDLRERRENLTKQLADLQKSGGDAWHSLRRGIDSALDELRDAWEKAKSRFH